ncbi:MAG TPA: hypothetical protein VF194_04475 [Ferrovibrio sp.]|uniref:hypothetical protein n=1 Tax=Ferrovibrio sp. TaxID=1917215 RepID=UPI002ED10B00
MTIIRKTAMAAVNDNGPIPPTLFIKWDQLMSSAEIQRGMAQLAWRMGYRARALFMPTKAAPGLIVPPEDSIVVAMDARRDEYRATAANSKLSGTLKVMLPSNDWTEESDLLEADIYRAGKALGLSVMLLTSAGMPDAVRLESFWAIYAWTAPDPRLPAQARSSFEIEFPVEAPDPLSVAGILAGTRSNALRWVAAPDCYIPMTNQLTTQPRRTQEAA